MCTQNSPIRHPPLNQMHRSSSSQSFFHFLELLPRGQGVPEDQDDRIAAQEHLGDEAVAVHGLGLFLACNREKGMNAQDHNKRNTYILMKRGWN